MAELEELVNNVESKIPENLKNLINYAETINKVI